MDDDMCGDFFGEKPHQDEAIAESRWELNSYKKYQNEKGEKIMKKNEVKKNNKGFSLVELIVVIAIMAVLVGVLAPQFIQYVNKSRAATDVQNTSQLKTAIETYCADYEGSATEFTIKKSTDKKKFEVTSTGDTTAAGAALTNAGISTAGVAIKYTKWKDDFAMKYKFDATDGKWSWEYTNNTVTVGSTTYTAQ